MVTIEGVQYPTVAEAAQFLGVSTRAVRDYVNKGIIPQPPSIDQGARSIDTFPPDYLEKAKRALRDYRVQKRQRRTHSNGN